MDTKQEETVQPNENAAAQNTATELKDLNPSFFKKCINRIKSSPYLFVIGTFFLPFFIMMGAHAAMSYFPFGNQSILTLDFQAQYIYYFGAVRRLLTQGGSWLYTWSRTLGGEFMGYVTYYMGSPFNLLIVLFPEKHLAMAASFVVLTKIGAMGVTMSIYLKKTRKLSDVKILMFSTMYALCGYVPIQQFNPMWLDALIWLPMVVLGVERLVRQRKVLLYIISLSLLVMANYYIGYMCCIFTGIYFICYYFLVRPELMEEHKPRGRGIVKFFNSYGFNTFGRFFLSTVLMLMISAFILVCAYYSLTFGKNGFSNPDFSFNLRFDFLDLFVKMLAGSYDTVRDNGLPNIYSGLLALTLIPVFYIVPGITRRKKVIMSILVSVLVMSFMINPVDLAWHGFSTPNWLNYRYSFLFSFLIVLMAAEAFEHFKEIKFRVYAVSCVAIIFLVFVVQKLNYSFQQSTKTLELSDLMVILLSVGVIALYAGIMMAVHSGKKESSAVVALAVIVSLELFGNAAINIGQMENDVGTVRYNNYLSGGTNSVERYDSYVGSVERLQVIFDKIKEGDTSFYRTESTVYRQRGGVNEQMAVGFNGISSSTSTLNKYVIRIINKLGYASTSHWSKYLGGTPVGDALLGIKYVISTDRPTEANGNSIANNNKHSFDGNFYVKAYEVDEPDELTPSSYKIYAMQNTKALSVVYAVSRNLASIENVYDVNPYYTAMDLQNQMINSMLSETLGYDINVFRPIDTTYSYSHATVSKTKIGFKWDGEQQNANYYVVTKVSDDASITFKFTAPVDGVIYFHFPTVNFGQTAKIYVNGEFLTDYFGNETTCAMELGTFTAGEKVEVELNLDGDKLYIANDSESFFWYVDVDAMDTAFDLLSESSMYIENYTNSSLSGVITVPQGQELVFTTIPYDAGWNVYVDGVKVETECVLDAFLAFETTAGEHELKLVYFPTIYKIGLAVSAVGIAILIVLIVYAVCPKFRNAVKKKFPSPEDDRDDDEDEKDPAETELAETGETAPPDSVISGEIPPAVTEEPQQTVAE